MEICRMCNLPFVPKDGREKYCSQLCREGAEKRRYKIKYEKSKKRYHDLYHGIIHDSNYKRFEIERHRVATTAERVQMLIDDLETTLTGLAVGCEIPYQTLVGLLNGQREELSVSTLVRIAEHTGYDIDWLIGMED